MTNPNRIHSLAVTPDVARQTPKNDFGDVMAQGLKNGVAAAAGIVGGAIPGVPVLSAAVSGIQNLLGMGAIQSGGTSANVAPSVAGLGAVGAAATVGGGGGVTDIQSQSTGSLLQSMANNPDGSSAAYLELQMRMARESQQFTALSNVLKVRADSAKAAINNIR
jgi:hypothetical protein